MGERPCWVVEGVVERPRSGRVNGGTLETEEVDVESAEVGIPKGKSSEVERPGAKRIETGSDESRVSSMAEAVSVEGPEIELDDSDVVEGLGAHRAGLVLEWLPHACTVAFCETTKAAVPNSKPRIEAGTMISILHTRLEGEFDSRQRKASWFHLGSI